MIRNLQSLGKTILLTTHYMDEAEHLADRVAIMVDGEIVAEGPPGDLSQRDGSVTIVFRIDSGSGALPEDLGAEQTGNSGRYTITTSTPTRSLHQLTGWAVEQGIELQELSVSRPSLEDLFIELANPQAKDGEEA